MLAYHNDPAIKSAILAQLREHREADKLVKGQYWENGKGCAIACTIHSSDHAEYESRFGVPQMLARLEDCIFEGLPNADAQAWPELFMGAIEPGRDLSRVGWQFLHWLLTDSSVNPGIEHPLVRDAVKQCANVILPLTKGLKVDLNAASAAWSAAWSAARSAAWSADSAAWSAARSAESAARSADSAAGVAGAARSAESAAGVAGAAYKLMATKLVKLITEA